MSLLIAYRLILGRDPTAAERDAEATRGAGGADPLPDRLLLTPEFREAYFALTGDTPGPIADRYGCALASLGSHVHFVDLLYEHLLGRRADPGGRDHYLGALARGEARLEVLRAILRSDEFGYRLVQMAPYVPRDVQLCELANPAKWDNPDWMALLEELRILPADKPRMHRKGYELTQLLFGLQRLGMLGPERSIISVGAGHECVLYALANRVRWVAATDTYEEAWEAARGAEGDQRVLSSPDAYAPFPYRRDALSFFRMDGRRLGFRDGVFDIAYSLSSIEHFGGLAGARSAVDEMARVVKPGGVVVVATEYHLSGPRRPDVFDAAEVSELFARPTLRLIEPLDNKVYHRYRCMPIDLVSLPFQTPHLVVKAGGTMFTSAIAFLQRVG